MCWAEGGRRPLEEGKHAAESGMELKAYAEAAGKAHSTMHDKVKAYRVMADTNVRIGDVSDGWVRLSIIHAAPAWLWSALVAKMLEGQWTVATTRQMVANVKAADREGGGRRPPAP